MHFSLRKNEIYAIVDIEATGGSIGADERIIQFACVLLKNGKIINRFETLVNPSKRIPEPIEKLTGIKNKDVKDAPYFEEVAPTILTLLESTIFIAHNVGFDYRFLNEQFKAHGFKQLSIPAVDTVELTQILYPTLDSFQLEDIAAFLDYTLSDAHDALADADATVHIFQKLYERALSLPLVTLEKLHYLATCTTHNTNLFFERVLEEALELLEPLDENLVIINQIAIRKPDSYEERAVNTWKKQSYPETVEEKKKFIAQGHDFREVQANMMDLVHGYFKEDLSIQKLAIEAPPGIGKSMGYLFPILFETTLEEKIVISTYTTLLQEQLLNDTIPKIEEVFGRQVPTTLLKSRNHYLSLSIFERWLREVEPNNSEAYVCMRVLVWLTDTKTGDLSEMNAGSHLDLQFWQEIRVTNHHYIDNHWRDFDFYERIKEKITHSEVIITNHHFLVYDWQNEEPTIPSLEHLIIDEAHHFPEVANKASTNRLSGKELNKQLDKMGMVLEETGIFKLINYLEKNKVIKAYDLLNLERNSEMIMESWLTFFERQVDFYDKQNFSTRKDSNFVEHEIKLEYFSLKEKKILKTILIGIEEFLYTGFEITRKAMNDFKNLNNDMQLLLIEFSKLLAFLKDFKQNFQKVFIYDDNAPQALRWVSYVPNNVEATFNFHVLKWGEENSFIDFLATQSKVLFTSSTLSINDSVEYFSDQLNNLPLEFHQLDSLFNYSEQVRVMVPENRIHPKGLNENEYSEQLAAEIKNILKNTRLNTVILFRSLSVLKEVYEVIHNDPELYEHRILAQSLSGTRKRILKNYKRHTPSVILGADSFFEGIDLPNEALELVILTRLPFPAPNTPIMRLKTDFLNKQGLNPFMKEYLPQALMKFRQAFGRLIRNKTDRGVLVVLDDRFITAGYSKIFQSSLPKNVEVEEYDNNRLGGKIQAFIDEKPADNI